MKRLFVLSTLAASLVLAARAPAQTASKPDAKSTGQAAGKQQREKEPTQQLRTIEGVISGVDMDDVELRNNTGTRDFELDESVRIYRDGKPVPRAAIRYGDRARATYQENLEGVLEDDELVRLDLEPSTPQ